MAIFFGYSTKKFIKIIIIEFINIHIWKFMELANNNVHFLMAKNLSKSRL